MIKVAVSNGHVEKSGARGNGYEEHFLVSRITPFIMTYLIKDGRFDVRLFDNPEMTNSHDLSLTVEQANDWGAALFVEMHMDSNDSSSPKGAHAIYHPNSKNGKLLAECVSEFMTPILPGRSSTEVARDNLYVVNKTDMAAIIEEGGFISNPDNAKLAAEHPEVIGEAVAKGIIKYAEVKGLVS